MPKNETIATGQVITCPYCKKEIQLTQALAGEIEAKIRARLEEENKVKQEKMETEARRRAAEDVGKTVEGLKKEILKSQKRQRDLEEQIVAKDRAVEEAQQQEIEFRRKKRELEEKEKSFQLQVERAIDDQRKKMQEEFLTRQREKDMLIEGLNKKLQEMEQKIQQGSQQVQGEAQELELEDALKAAFPIDAVLPVPKGIKGADILHRVLSKSGRQGGVILWESKRTKSWSKEWIDKLKSDQREVKADMAVIVSKVLPEGVTHITSIGGVWVCDFQSALGLALVLRESLALLDQANMALEGKSEKMEMVYRYLSGMEFSQRVTGLLEAYAAMKKDLDKERSAMESLYSKRDAQLKMLLKGIAGIYGDLQGMTGNALPEIKNLELPPGKL